MCVFSHVGHLTAPETYQNHTPLSHPSPSLPLPFLPSLLSPKLLSTSPDAAGGGGKITILTQVLKGTGLEGRKGRDSPVEQTPARDFREAGRSFMCQSVLGASERMSVCLACCARVHWTTLDCVCLLCQFLLHGRGGGSCDLGRAYKKTQITLHLNVALFFLGNTERWVKA